MLALAVAAAIHAAPGPAPHPPRPSLIAQAVALAPPPQGQPQPAPSADSVRNGALIGAGIVGGSVLVQGFRTCREAGCAPDVLLWTSVGAGLGALAGAAIDKIF